MHAEAGNCCSKQLILPTVHKHTHTHIAPPLELGRTIDRTAGIPSPPVTQTCWEGMNFLECGSNEEKRLQVKLLEK